MKNLNIFLFMILGQVCISCGDNFWDNDSKRITGDGEIKETTIHLPDFEFVDLEGVANVYIETGYDQKVTMKAYENILSYMVAEVIGDELILRFKENISVNSDEEIRIDISMPSLSGVNLSGVGNFYISGPPQELLSLEINGVGNIEAYGLPVYCGVAEINGTGNIEIRAKETLTVDIDGLGNVYYHDFPELTIDISGLGEVVNDN